MSRGLGLRDRLDAIGLDLPASFPEWIEQYLDELARWSTVSRLTGYATWTSQVEHLVLDSLRLLAVLPTPSSPLLDIGSGGGAPGLVLKLARPAWHVTLVEANRRRANFLRHLVRLLALSDIEVEGGRAETLATSPSHRGAYQTVTFRAVMPWTVAVSLSRSFLRPEGHVAIGLGPGAEPPWGRVVPAECSLEGLPRKRAFLIIRATDIPADVPRGTRRRRGLRPGHRQSEGRGG